MKDCCSSSSTTDSLLKSLSNTSAVQSTNIVGSTTTAVVGSLSSSEPSSSSLSSFHLDEEQLILFKKFEKYTLQDILGHDIDDCQDEERHSPSSTSSVSSSPSSSPFFISEKANDKKLEIDLPWTFTRRATITGLPSLQSKILHSPVALSNPISPNTSESFFSAPTEKLLSLRLVTDEERMIKDFIENRRKSSPMEAIPNITRSSSLSSPSIRQHSPGTSPSRIPCLQKNTGCGIDSTNTIPPATPSASSSSSSAAASTTTTTTLSAARKQLSAPEKAKVLYKTELCRSWELQQKCDYGTKCQFAHGKEELRQLPKHKNYKTELCRMFHQNQQCPFGSRCAFIHDEPRALSRVTDKKKPRRDHEE